MKVEWVAKKSDFQEKYFLEINSVKVLEIYKFSDGEMYIEPKDFKFLFKGVPYFEGDEGLVQAKKYVEERLHKFCKEFLNEHKEGI